MYRLKLAFVSLLILHCIQQNASEPQNASKEGDNSLHINVKFKQGKPVNSTEGRNDSLNTTYTNNYIKANDTGLNSSMITTAETNTPVYNDVITATHASNIEVTTSEEYNSISEYGTTLGLPKEDDNLQTMTPDYITSSSGPVIERASATTSNTGDTSSTTMPSQSNTDAVTTSIPTSTQIQESTPNPTSTPIQESTLIPKSTPIPGNTPVSNVTQSTQVPGSTPGSSLSRTTPVPCPTGCRCTAGRTSHSRHHYHRILAAYRTQRLLYGPGRSVIPYRPHKNPNHPGGRQMVCVGLPDMPDYLPNDVEKVTMYGSLSQSWEMQQLDEPDDPNSLYNSDSAAEAPNGLRQITTLGKLNVIRSRGMKQLVVEGNKLMMLFPNDFEMLASLKHLHLRNNQIRMVSPGAFNGLTSVQEIDLSENHLHHLSKTSFYMLRKIKKISLAKNRLVTLHPNMFSDLPNLMNLDISFNFFSDLPKGIFSKNSKIKILTMNSNSFIELHEEWLQDLPSLTKLDFSSNRIYVLPNNSFSDHVNVTWLNFNSNNLKNLTYDQLEGLNKLEIFKVQYNNISYIEDGAFTNKTSLRELYLDGNWIQALTLEMLDGLDHLKTLSLTENKLTSINNATFKSVPKLQTLKLSHNSIKTITHRNFFGLLDLLELRLDHNQIKFIEDDGFAVSIVHSFSKLTWLHINHNKLNKITAKMFKGLDFLKYLNIGHNDIQVIDESGFTGFRRLNTLIMNENSVSEIRPGTFKQLDYIRHMNLASNVMSVVGFNMLLGLKTLEDLNLQNNELTEMDYQVFLDTPRLSSLNLRKNKIQYVDLYLLDTLDKLRHLDLSNNKLSNVTLPIFRRRSLFSFNLADNYFRTLPIEITRVVSQRGSIHLYGNPWMCDCRLQWLADRTKEVEGVYIVKPEDIVCKSPKTLIGEKISMLSRPDMCSRQLTYLPASDQRYRKLDTGCMFSPLARMYGTNTEIRKSATDPFPWVTNIFSHKNGDWLCAGVRMARDYILLHTSCVKQQNFKSKVKVVFGSMSDDDVKLHYTVVEEIEFYSGPLDLAMIKISKIKGATARVFPCVLNEKAVLSAKINTTNAVVVSMAINVKDKIKVKLHSFPIYTVTDPCVPGYLCFKVNVDKISSEKYAEEHLPIFFKVGKSRWALGSIGDLKAYGNILSNPLSKAIDWIHKTIK